MKEKIVIAITILFSFYWTSGQDTIWHNQFLQKTSKEKAFSYQVQTKDSVGYIVTEYYKNNSIQMKGHSLSSDSLFKVGNYCYFDNKGKITSQGNYTNNKKTGIWNQYYPNGQLYIIKNFSEDGKIDGNALYFYPNGKLKRSENYSNGLILSGKCYAKSGVDTTYYPSEEYPEFKGGEQKMNKFLKDNLKYPEQAYNREIQGTVYVSFVVDEKGRIKNIIIEKGINVILNSAAYDVISIMPKWKPGRLEGKPIKSKVILPISFKLH